MEKALQVIEEMTRLGIIKAYAIGGGIAATYYIEPILTYDLDIFFIPVKEGLDMPAPIYEYAKARGYGNQAEAILIEGFPVQFIPAYNDLVQEAVADAATLTYLGSLRSGRTPIQIVFRDVSHYEESLDQVSSRCR